LISYYQFIQSKEWKLNFIQKIVKKVETVKKKLRIILNKINSNEKNENQIRKFKNWRGDIEKNTNFINYSEKIISNIEGWNRKKKIINFKNKQKKFNKEQKIKRLEITRLFKKNSEKFNKKKINKNDGS